MENNKGFHAFAKEAPVPRELQSSFFKAQTFSGTLRPAGSISGRWVGADLSYLERRVFGDGRLARSGEKAPDGSEPQGGLLRFFSQYIRLSDGTWTAAGTVLQVWRWRLHCAWKTLCFGDIGSALRTTYKRDVFAALYGGKNKFRDGPVRSAIVLSEGRHNPGTGG